MSNIFGKVLELVNIQTINDQTFLHIMCYYEQEVELLWKIDNHTASNIKEIFNYDGIHKYRFSLHTAFDTNNNSYISMVTRTYRDQSERLYFTCSLDFINELESIKTVQNIQELLSSPFLFSIQLIENEIQELLGNRDENRNVPKKHSFPFKWKAITIIFILGFALYGYSNSLINISGTIETNAMNVEEENPNVSVEKDSLEEESENFVADEEKKQPEYNIPIIDVTESMTFSLPEGYVALTFDDGPSIYTTQIADVLKEYEVGGTFFFIGTNAKKYPEHVDYVQSSGFSIGSHTMNHPNMANLTYDQQLNEIQQSIRVIEDITNQDVVLFRPPYGSYKNQTKEIVLQNHYNMVLWNIDPKDWKTRNAERIYHDSISMDTSGSIILLHESQAVVEALPNIIDHLKEQGLKIVNLQ